MMRRTSLMRMAGLAAIPFVVLALSSCTSGASKTSATIAPSTGQPPGTVDVANTNLGSILVDSRGRTLYLFQADNGTTSACSGTCAAAWPPILANGQPTAANGANSSLIGTTQRTDGNAQVTYNGHPVYAFAQDQKPGDTKGEGITAFGGAWYVLSPAGNEITSAPAKGSSGSSGY